MINAWHKAGLTALNLTLITGIAVTTWEYINKKTAIQIAQETKENLENYIERQKHLNSTLVESNNALAKRMIEIGETEKKLKEFMEGQIEFNRSTLTNSQLIREAVFGKAELPNDNKPVA